MHFGMTVIAQNYQISRSFMTQSLVRLMMQIELSPPLTKFTHDETVRTAHH